VLCLATDSLSDKLTMVKMLQSQHTAACCDLAKDPSFRKTSNLLRLGLCWEASTDAVKVGQASVFTSLTVPATSLNQRCDVEAVLANGKGYRVSCVTAPPLLLVVLLLLPRPLTTPPPPPSGTSPGTGGPTRPAKARRGCRCRA